MGVYAAVRREAERGVGAVLRPSTASNTAEEVEVACLEAWVLVEHEVSLGDLSEEAGVGAQTTRPWPQQRVPWTAGFLDAPVAGVEAMIASDSVLSESLPFAIRGAAAA